MRRYITKNPQKLEYKIVYTGIIASDTFTHVKPNLTVRSLTIKDKIRC
jgi:hypothetical protein